MWLRARLIGIEAGWRRSRALRRTGRAANLAAITILLALALALTGSRHTAQARGAAASSARALDAHRAAATEATADGERLRATWAEDGLRKAIKRFAAARAQWHAAGDTQAELRALASIGELHAILSEYGPALTSYRAALALSRATHNSSAEVEALNQISAIYIYLGDQTQAAAYCQRAYQLSEAAGDDRGRAQALSNMGEVAYCSADMRGALEKFGQALALWRDDERRAKAHTLLNLGYTQFDLRNMDEALGSYKQALSLYQAVLDRQGEALTLTAMGGAYSYLGNKQTALDYHNRAVNLLRTMGDRNGEAVALNGLGYVYRNLGEYQKALDCYVRARQLFHELGNREYENFTITCVGKAYQGLGENEKALACYRELSHRAVSYSLTRASALNAIGSIYQSMGEPRAARDNYEQALRLYRAIEDKLGEASILNNLGHVVAATGEHAAALVYYKRALALSRSVRDRSGEVAALLNIGQALRATGQLEEARACVEESLALIESLRTQVVNQALRASYTATVHQHFELYIDLLMQLHKRQPGAGLDALAFQVSERAHARSLLDMLTEVRGDIRQGLDQALVTRERAVGLALGEVSERQSRLLNSKHTAAEAAALTIEAQALSAEYDEIERQLREQSPRYAALTQPRALRLAEIQQQVLDDDTLLLEYSLGDERSYLWAVGRADATAYELAGRTEIESAARRVYELLAARQHRPAESAADYQARVNEADAHYWREAAALSDLLLGPAAARLKAKRLLIVADGALQYVPFAALPAPGAQPGGASPADEAHMGEPLPLAAAFEVIGVPSASILSVLREEVARRQHAPRAVAVLADPVFERDDPRLLALLSAESRGAQADGALLSDALHASVLPASTRAYPRLPASLEEADAIIATAAGSALKATGFAASRATALDAELGEYRIIHFATHGVIDSERPELSYLVLSLLDERGQAQDGFLLLRDIYNLRLPADLVVLSACNTGLGKNVNGEGLVGLTRGFMYAGAAGVVASLWKVDDDATAEMMKIFYRRMLSDGQTPAAALRGAQLEIMQQRRWRAPYYWAGFMLQGDYHVGGAARGQPGAGGLATVAVVAILLLLGGAYSRRRRKARLG